MITVSASTVFSPSMWPYRAKRRNLQMWRCPCGYPHRTLGLLLHVLHQIIAGDTFWGNRGVLHFRSRRQLSRRGSFIKDQFQIGTRRIDYGCIAAGPDPMMTLYSFDLIVAHSNDVLYKCIVESCYLKSTTSAFGWFLGLEGKKKIILIDIGTNQLMRIVVTVRLRIVSVIVTEDCSADYLQRSWRSRSSSRCPRWTSLSWKLCSFCDNCPEEVIGLVLCNSSPEGLETFTSSFCFM